VLGFRAPLLAVVFIDPEIVIHYVADGHNDVLSVAAILWAMALRERSVVAATLLAIVSGTIKASYTIVALLIVHGEQRRGRQIAIAGTILVGTLVVSALAGGRAYLHGLTWHASANTLAVPVWQQAMHAGAILAAVVAIATAIYKRTLFEAAYTLPAFTAAMYSWYLVLGIPYAVLNRRYAVAFFTIGVMGVRVRRGALKGVDKSSDGVAAFLDERYWRAVCSDQETLGDCAVWFADYMGLTRLDGVGHKRIAHERRGDPALQQRGVHRRLRQFDKAYGLRVAAVRIDPRAGGDFVEIVQCRNRHRRADVSPMQSV
jgi:hypothetical protein